ALRLCVSARDNTPAYQIRLDFKTQAVNVPARQLNMHSAYREWLRDRPFDATASESEDWRTPTCASASLESAKSCDASSANRFWNRCAREDREMSAAQKFVLASHCSRAVVLTVRHLSL